MGAHSILRLGTLKDVASFQKHLHAVGLQLPCDASLQAGASSPFSAPVKRGEIRIGNSFAVQPMEGWDAESDGNPSAFTLRRWQRFGRTGAKLIWGGEAVAVRHEGRASPNQLVIAPHTMKGIERLRAGLIEEHQKATGSVQGLVVGLQLTHSGRYSKPNHHSRHEPRILYRHPILDRKLALPPEYPVLADGEICGIIEDFHRAGRAAQELGFDFVDIKHCHGYLGHEFLSAHSRDGRYGGSFENRTRFLREVVEGIRSVAPGLKIGVRLSAFDTVPYRPDPLLSSEGKLGPGIPESYTDLLPYRWGFGVDALNPEQPDLSDATQFLSLLRDLGIQLVNLTAGSPYYNPHLQRPAYYPPSDGYQPPEDPLIRVAQHLDATRKLKAQFPDLIIVGSAFSYLQDFLPHVAQAVLREGWMDLISLGRMTLSYPEMILDVIEGRPLQKRHVCRTFSDCTTAPRKGLPSGCYPLDPHYKASKLAAQLKTAKAGR